MVRDHPLDRIYSPIYLEFSTVSLGKLNFFHIMQVPSVLRVLREFIEEIIKSFPELKTHIISLINLLGENPDSSFPICEVDIIWMRIMGRRIITSHSNLNDITFSSPAKLQYDQ